LPRSRKTRAKSSSNSKSRSWSVYLILSTNRPIKTYVGVTTNFSRRCVYFFDSALIF
jgi:structure-specific endonuclease subunit SLX1